MQEDPLTALDLGILVQRLSIEDVAHGVVRQNGSHSSRFMTE
jgi:hypothetical protein